MIKIYDYKLKSFYKIGINNDKWLTLNIKIKSFALNYKNHLIFLKKFFRILKIAIKGNKIDKKNI